MCTGVSCVKAVRAKESDCKEVLSFVYRANGKHGSICRA